MDGSKVSNESTPTESKIEILREDFKNNYADNIKEDLYDARDLNKFNEDNTYASKFVRPHAKTSDRAVTVHESFKWRKEFGIADLKKDDIPMHLWNLNAMYFHGRDKKGNQIVWIEVNKYSKVPGRLEESKKLFAYLIEKFTLEHPTERVVVLFDLTNSGLSNYDMDIIRFVIASFTTYYPGILAYLLIYEAPWLFNAIWRIIKTLLKAEQVAYIKFVKKNAVQEYIDKEHLFEHMDGPHKREPIGTQGNETSKD